MRTGASKPDLETDITVSYPLWDDLDFDFWALAEKAVAHTIEKADLPVPLGKEKKLEVSILLADDEDIRQLNRQYRGQDKPTNVLSFAALEGEEMPLPQPDTNIRHLGDLALAYETLEKETVELKTTFKDHFLHMIVHGTLHLLGYDHQEENEAEEMESLEISILSGFGVKNPYEREKNVA